MITWELKCGNCNKALGLTKVWPLAIPTQDDADRYKCMTCGPKTTAAHPSKWTTNDVPPIIADYMARHGVVCDLEYTGPCRCTHGRARKALLRHCQGYPLLDSINEEISKWKVTHPSWL